MKINWFILIAMLFCHVLDDYTLQGILASMKQKKWWKEHAPHELYKYDYIIALIMHSISWSFMIMLPIAISHSFEITPIFIVFFIINVVIHAITDHLKANMLKINLIIDQTIHIVQIVLTFLLCV